jgi:hypothetical protein
MDDRFHGAPNAIVPVVVGLTESPPVADDRVGVANGTPKELKHLHFSYWIPA